MILRRIVVLLLFAGPLHAAAAEWFVSTTGSDATGNGTAAAPFRTLTHLLDPGDAIVDAGDIVTVRGPAGNNVYDECDVRLRVPLTLRSPPGERAHIRCDLAVEYSVTVQIDPEASGSTLSNLELSGGYYYALFLQTDWEQGGNPGGHGASDILVEDVEIHHSGRDGIKITPKCDDVTIRRAHIHHTGAIYPPGTPPDDKNAEGIDNVNGARMVVEDSHIHDTATTGVYFKGGAADAVVQRNVIERTGAAGILVGFDTSPEFFDLDINPEYYEAIRGTVRNNIVRDTRYSGIGLFAAQDALVANNTLIGTARVGHAALYFGVTLQDSDPDAGRPPSTNPRIRNNLVLQDGGACAGVRWADEIDANGVYGLVGDPGTDSNRYHDSTGACRFFDTRPAIDYDGDLAGWRTAEGTDAASSEGPVSIAADGRLVPGSVAIDAGQTLPEVTDDIDREPRTGANDIGADELDAAALFADGFEGD